MEFSGIDFFMGDMIVGILRAGVPREDGEHAYEPYRGPGHHALAIALAAGEAVRCTCASAEGRLRFSVVAIPRYGILQIVDAAIEPDWERQAFR